MNFVNQDDNIYLSKQIAKPSFVKDQLQISSRVFVIEESIFSQMQFLRSISGDSDNIQFASINCIFFTKKSDGFFCFPSGDHISKCQIPTSVISIGHSAFSDCLNLQSIAIPTSAIAIGDS